MGDADQHGMMEETQEELNDAIIEDNLDILKITD